MVTEHRIHSSIGRSQRHRPGVEIGSVETRRTEPETPGEAEKTMTAGSRQLKTAFIVVQ